MFKSEKIFCFIFFGNFFILFIFIVFFEFLVISSTQSKDTNLLPFEQNTLITSLINYLSENVLNKDKLKEIYIFILQAIARYLIMLLFHSHYIHIFEEQPILIENNILHDLGLSIK